MQPFHLAIPVHDLSLAEDFYGGLLACEKGRFCQQWIDWDFWGHQVVTHLDSNMRLEKVHNEVDGKQVPVPHFGLVLRWQEWHFLADRLQNNNCHFVIEPGIRFAGQPGEQATLFLLDYSGNALEFKSFKHPEQLFARD